MTTVAVVVSVVAVAVADRLHLLTASSLQHRLVAVAAAAVVAARSLLLLHAVATGLNLQK